jgi:hypothetical protein
LQSFLQNSYLSLIKPSRKQNIIFLNHYLNHRRGVKKMADSDKGRIQEDSGEDDTHQRSSKGRGWFGDSARHAEAGRKGGLARSRKYHSKMSA